MAVLKQRRVPAVVTGFCRTKLAPISKACWVVVLPLRMAKDTEVLLLGFLRRLRRTSAPPCRSSQSTMTASNLAEESSSAPAAGETSTSMESFSRVGQRTRTTSASRHTSKDSRFIKNHFRLACRRLKGTKVTDSLSQIHGLDVLARKSAARKILLAARVAEGGNCWHERMRLSLPGVQCWRPRGSLAGGR